MIIKNIAWIGGFMDGEGSFMLTEHRQRNNLGYDPRISCPNTNPLNIEALYKYTQMGYICDRTVNNPRAKSAQVWSLRVKEQKIFLPLIIPHLVCKRKQAELLLEYFQVVDGLSQTRIGTISLELAELNKRGA